jgi:polyhydroxybutyrate depolymerase
MRFQFLIGLLLAVMACAPPVRAETLDVGDGTRSYQLYVPPGLRTGADPAPLVILLHGGGGSGDRLRQSLGMDAVANREGFLVAYPDGLGQHWNDGRFGAPTRGKQPGASDDVAFLTKLAQVLVGQGKVAAGRIAVGGVSNGGMMAFRLACETNGVFSAYAAVIANLSQELSKACAPKAPVPMMVLAGTADVIMPYKGGQVGGGLRGVVVSADDTYAFWAKSNRCSGPGNANRLADRNQGDKSHVEVLRAEGCTAQAMFYRVVGGGHQAPSLTGVVRPALDAFVGPANRDIETAEEIWAFVSGRRR